MLRPTTRIARAAALLLALLLGGCSDDNDEGGSDASADQAVLVDQGQSPDGPAAEAAPPPGDGTPAADTGPAPDIALPTQNSGAICTPGGSCPNAGEECIMFDASLGKGMCLDPCAKQGDACPVPDTTTQISVCSVTGLTPGTWYCGWFCELGGKSYQCPNATDYKCVAAANGDAKYCQPK